MSEKDFPGSEDAYLKNLTFLSLLGYDIFMKKKLMEHIIDDMAEEQRLKEEAIKAREAKKEARKDIKKDSKREPKKK